MTKTGELTPMPIACGDKVLIDKYAGQEITIEDEDYVIVRSDDIIAIHNPQVSLGTADHQYRIS